jgi:hypothetical protein
MSMTLALAISSTCLIRSGLRLASVRINRTLAPSAGIVFPPWQGMQYLRDMMSGRGELSPLDNARYGKTDWTDIRTMISGLV